MLITCTSDPIDEYPAIVVTHSLQTTWDVQDTAGHNPATLTKVFGVDSLPTGASISTNYVIVSGNDVTLDNWDFTGCAGVEVRGDNCTLTNCLILPGDDTESGSNYALEITATAQGCVVNNCTMNTLHMKKGANTLISRPGATVTFNDCVSKNGETKSQGTAVFNRHYFYPGATSHDAHLDLIQPDQGSIALYQCFFDCRHWDGYGILDHATRAITNIANTGADRVRLTFSSEIPDYWIANGERGLQIQGVGGATQLNANGISQGHFWRMYNIVDEFTVDLAKVSDAGTLAGINYSSLSAYTSGGTAQISPIPFTNYIRGQAGGGTITDLTVDQCICVGFDQVPGSFNPHALVDNVNPVQNVTWTNSLWDLGVNGSFFDEPITDGIIIEWSGNYNFDTGVEFSPPSVE